MRKIICILFVTAFACSSFFVKSVQAIVPAPISEQDLGIATITGQIESVSRECSPKGTMATITIVDKNGKRVIIEVKADTGVYDEDGKTIALDEIQKGDKVTIKYREMKKTTEKAESIRLTK